MRLTLVNVSKSWHEFQLSKINLEIYDKEYFVLLGPTGAGKTLLLETIMGFHTLDSGLILIDGNKINDLKSWERNIAYLPQTSNISSEMTVRENIEYGLKRRQIAEKWKKAVDGIMRVMGLKAIQDRKALHLSGGEKRKVALARALILEPSVILLDEPLSNIDEEKKKELQRDIKMIHNYLDLTVIHVTHDKQEAYSLADRIGIIKKGEILQVGQPQDIWSHPNSREIASFMGYENIYRGELVSQGNDYSKIKIGNEIIKVLGCHNEKKFYALIGNYDIELSRDYHKGINDNVLSGRVKEIIDMGSIIKVIIDIGVEVKVTMTEKVFRESSIETGEKTWLKINSSDIKVIPF